MKTIHCIPEANELMSAIIEELPNNRGEAYYALSMVLEMLQSRCTELLVPEPGERITGDSGGTGDAKDKDKDGDAFRFKMTIDAYDLEDLRAQMRDAYAHTYSEGFEKGERIG